MQHFSLYLQLVFEIDSNYANPATRLQQDFSLHGCTPNCFVYTFTWPTLRPHNYAITKPRCSLQIAVRLVQVHV